MVPIPRLGVLKSFDLLFTLLLSAVVIGLFNEAFSTQVAGTAGSVQ